MTLLLLLLLFIHTTTLAKPPTNPCPINQYNSHTDALINFTTNSLPPIQHYFPKCIPLEKHPLYNQSCSSSSSISNNGWSNNKNQTMTMEPCLHSQSQLVCYRLRCAICVPNQINSDTGMYCQELRDGRTRWIAVYLGWDFLDKPLLLWMIFIGLLLVYFIIYLLVNYNKYSNQAFKRQYQMYIYFIIRKINRYQ